MRSACVAGAVYLLLLGSMAKSDLTRFPLCTESGTQENPAMSGSVAVWADQRNGTENSNIYAYLFSEPNELAVCTAAGNQVAPALSGPFIVWQDYRSGGSDIYGYDLLIRDEFSICLDGSSQQNPDISDTVVVWQDNRYGNQDILGYDLDSETDIQVCTNTSAQYYPAIDWPWVVWVDTRNSGNLDIYAKNLQTGIEYPICTNAAVQYNPDVSGGLAVWQDERNKTTQGTDIYARQLPDGEEFLLCGAADEQMFPAIDGSLIAWQDRRNGTYDIYAYDLNTQSLAAVNTESGDQKQAAVCGNRILWSNGDDVYYADMPVPTVLTVLVPNGGEMVLADSSMEILWQTEGPSPDYIRIVYSADGGQTWDFVNAAAANTGQYLWEPLPDADSANCLIRISDAADPLVTDTSDAEFTIFRCDPSLTADLNGDCLVDLGDFSDFANQWLQCGNSYDPQWCFQ